MLRPIFAVLSPLAILVNLLAGGAGKAQYQYVEYKPQSTRDDTRTIALLQVARMVSRYDPARAAAVIAEVQQENKPPMDEGTLVDIISAQAFVAAGQDNQGALHDLLRQGFASANHMLLERQETRRNYVSIPALTPLVHIGMEKDPDFTIPFVEGLPASRVKAEVLLDAAHALGTRGAPHIGTPPQQSAEKPNL